jgi:predicted DCC family thiol-disulfide oxidoreductase YuxK
MTNTLQPGDTGWLLYDGNCTLCLQVVKQFKPIWSRVPLQAEALQTNWVKERLELTSPEDEAILLSAMRVLSATGVVYEGASAILYILRQFWWGRPFARIGAFPWVKKRLEFCYQWVAKRRHCSSDSICSIQK